MQQEGAPRWSSEVLQAMQTHLILLLNKANSNDSPCATEHVQAGSDPPSGFCHADIAPHLDLYSHLPLPYGWEQFLDLQTGQVYYIDWKKCRRSYLDPRSFSVEHEDSNDSEVSEYISDADTCSLSSFHHTTRLLHINKLGTSPMLQEDWDLMETRGWMALDCDNHSEVTCELKSPSHLIIRDCNSPSVKNMETRLSSFDYESTKASQIDVGVFKN